MTTNVLFLCWGNICRSPMAEVIARSHAEQAGVDLEVTSAGVSAEEQGHDIDPRAAEVLAGAGYEVRPHTAHRVTDAELAAADLVVAAEQEHLDVLARRGVDLGGRACLLTDFVPGATPGDPVPDPWFGSGSGFATTLDTLESAMPRLLERLSTGS